MLQLGYPFVFTAFKQTLFPLQIMVLYRIL